ncbi:MAG: lytic transglycosylase domain-containing protein [Candidatus Lambdaproteobacteria bacterium]|nr:lytic transglycosylase domain-containing protein [Candidatus Lambdaproteobacteria bacterium]
MGIRALPLLIALAALLASSCATTPNPALSRWERRPGASAGEVKDNRPQTWSTDNARVRKFRVHYMANRTVETGLQRGRFFLPAIVEEFQRRKLPVELAYLPLVESNFQVRADSGHARGLWQFTRQTAEHMGLRVGMLVDDRLNWRKATVAAASYLDSLGERFDYNWELALAAYNGGPNYLDTAIKDQRTRDFWALKLRQETAEYVPRFLAMLQVARAKSPDLVASR